MNLYQKALALFVFALLAISCGVSNHPSAFSGKAGHYVSRYDGNNGGPSIPNSSSNGGQVPADQTPAPLPISTSDDAIHH